MNAIVQLPQYRPAWPRKPADIWLGGPMTERDVILSPDEWVDVTDDTDIAALVAAEQTCAFVRGAR